MSGPPFNLEQLRLVSLIDRHRSFSRAAEAMGITQSAVSQQVRTIEQGLRRRLFQRGAGGLTPTADGESYLVYARAMLAIGEDAKRHFSLSPGEVEIRLGLTEDFARTALPTVLALFSHDHPAFAFNVECGLSTMLFNGMEEGRYDVVVAKRPGSAPRGERLWSEPLAWFGREEPALPLPDPIPLAVIPAPSVSREAMLDALRGAGRSWRVAFQSLSFGAIEAVVQAGIGVSAFGQHFCAPGLVEIGEAAGLPPLRPVDICLERSRRATGAAMDAFCALLRQAALLTTGQNASVLAAGGVG
ncbi:LysR family transcriptional regulator [Rhizosaccharibacter radicis]|uniref:LysR family transcriptional regulator n=1 Tax=Rhizosaccharibacter radicis TaxID=2782605 RepID=A0ABT1VV09_9PROT|nr:LysR family transcriptional regulator [Acetobacteraceae bacterium KSS12]